MNHPGEVPSAPAEPGLDRLRAADPSALEELVDRYAGRIYGFASRMCRDPEDARDVLQDTFIGALRGLAQFRGESSLSTWLFRIAANACLKMRRRGKAEPDRWLSLDDVPSPADPGGEAPDAVLARSDLRDRLEAAIRRLPPAYRAVLILRDVEGLSTEDTAEALGVGIPTVKTRLHRARRFVRRELLELFRPARIIPASAHSRAPGRNA